MKTSETKYKRQPVKIDPTLKELEGKVLFPEKLALAKEQLKNVKLPKTDALRG